MATHSSILAWRIPGTGAWWAAVYGVAQSRTRLTWLSSSIHERKVKAKSLSRVWLFATPCTVAYRFLHPWNFPSKRTGAGCRFLLQGILLIQGLNPGLQRCKQMILPSRAPGKLSVLIYLLIHVLCSVNVQLFVAPCTVACQDPLSMGSPRQEYWSGLPFPSPEDLPNPGIEPLSLVSDRERYVSYDITYMQNLKNDTNELIYIQNWAKWIYTMVRVLRNSEKGAVLFFIILFISVQFSHSVVYDSLQSHGPQHSRPPCPSLTPGVYLNSCLLSRWCHPTISSSVVPFSSCSQSLPASGSFQMSQLFASGGQRIGVSASASVLPMNTQDWFPLGWTAWISLQSKGLSRVFSNTIVQKHKFFSAQLSL